MSAATTQRLDPMEARRRMQRKVLGVVAAIGLVVLICQFVPTAARSVKADPPRADRATSASATGVPIVRREAVEVTWPLRILHDPFARPVAARPVVPSEPTDRPRPVDTDLDGLVIGAIVVGDVPQAVVGGVICREGDVVRGVTVLQIAAEGIVVEKGGMRYRLVP